MRLRQVAREFSDNDRVRTAALELASELEALAEAREPEEKT